MANIVNLGNARKRFVELRTMLDELSVKTYEVEKELVRELENLHYMLNEVNERIENDGKI